MGQRQRPSQMTLPGGMEIFYANRQEVAFLWEEMPAYFRHGIAIGEGDTLLDVGANIGLFSLYASRASHHKATIFAFEPIPSTFKILQQNIERHQLRNIKAFPVGLSLKAQTATFSTYPHCTGWCTMYPDESSAQRALMKRLALANIEAAPSFLRWLRWLPPGCVQLFWREQSTMPSSLGQVACQLKTISQIIREEKISASIC